MYVNQIAVFLENRPGRIGEFCNCLADAGIDIVTMSIADTHDFGILRAITRNNEKAIEVLKKAGFAARANDLIGINVQDEPGGLAKVLNRLSAAGIAVEYLYSYVRKEGEQATILIKTDFPEKTAELLKSCGDCTLLGNDII